MLTIKHVFPDGNEHVTEALNIQKGSWPGPNDRQSPPPEKVLYWMPDSKNTGPGEIEVGIVYVMNDNGATVAKYDLGGFHIAAEQSAA